MRSEHYAGFAQSVAGQLTMLIGGLAAVTVLAWFYVY
jgi:hypothetical protein